MSKKPRANSSLAEKELEKAEKQLDAFEQNVKDLTLDRMNTAPKQETEQQTKLSSKEIRESQDIYLKPKRSIGSREKFNEDYRQQYEFAKEYVQFIAENKEIPGETLRSVWTKPFAGLPAQEWDVPVNKVVWGPRFLAEQIKNAKYHRLRMQESVSTGADGMGQYYGSMVVDSTVQRLDAIPVTGGKRSIFVGASNF